MDRNNLNNTNIEDMRAGIERSLRAMGFAVKGVRVVDNRPEVTTAPAVAAPATDFWQEDADIPTVRANPVLNRYDANGDFKDALTEELYQDFSLALEAPLAVHFDSITRKSQMIDATAGLLLDVFEEFGYSPDEAKQMFGDIVDALTEGN